MKIGIVVFNWNYGEYLDVLLNKMKSILNVDSYEIYICDDGSSDNSLDVCRCFINGNSARNINLIESERINLGRSKPYLGQLENLEKIYKNGDLNSCDYIWLMDADDYFESRDLPSDFEKIISGKEVVFTKVINKSDDNVEYMPIKRKANTDLSIWPTISVTSSIIMSKQFLADNYQLIFNYNSDFDDVWLDSRVNMIASRIDNNKVEYINFPVYRLIHSNNDSKAMPLKRRIAKQIKSNNYFSSVCNGKKPMNFRTKVLDFLF